ncbi:G-protein coupled receptor 157 isoform X2 [Aphelocoma coerulescens]|uniref:G-protein coupled receptor 157 isoform X2 n=1 Tax=Aphelocoma coerulescens TaxID=39617 RepID=UPI003604ECEE
MAAPLPPTPLFAAERGAVLVSCALSCVGSALLLCTHAQWPELRTRPRQLLLYLSLADLLSALSYFYGVLQDFERTSWDCVLQGALSTFANTSSFFWTMAIALYLYLTIVRGSPTGTGLLWCFHAVSWGVPLAITVAAVALKKIGYDASNVSVGWCWVNLDAEDRLLWMLLTGKVWEILAYVTLPVLYILIKKHINRAHAALSEYRPILPGAPALQPRTSIADKKLILIPVIFIFLRIWSTVRFILTLCNSPAVQNSVLVVLHVRDGARAPQRELQPGESAAGEAERRRGPSLCSSAVLRMLCDRLYSGFLVYLPSFPSPSTVNLKTCLGFCFSA